MTVDINLNGPDGATGFTEASVSASQTAPDADATASDLQAALYGLTKRLMDNMNIQLQYQIQRSLPVWLSVSQAPGAGAAALPSGGIVAAPLTSPGGSAPATGTAPMPASGGQAVPNYLPGAGPAALGAAP